MQRYHIAGGDAEGGEGRGEAEAAAKGLRPGEDGAVVDEGGAVAVDGGGALEEVERRDGAAVGGVGAQPIHGVPLLFFGGRGRSPPGWIYGRADWDG